METVTIEAIFDSVLRVVITYNKYCLSFARVHLLQSFILKMISLCLILYFFKHLVSSSSDDM